MFWTAMRQQARTAVSIGLDLRWTVASDWSSTACPPLLLTMLLADQPTHWLQPRDGVSPQAQHRQLNRSGGISSRPRVM